MVDQNDVSEEPIKGLMDGNVGGAVHVDDHTTHGQIVGSEDVHVDEPDWLMKGMKDQIILMTYLVLRTMRCQYERASKRY